MCGFAGWLRTGGPVGSSVRGGHGPGGAGERSEWLRRMGDQLARRGPDATTTYDDGRLAVVFRRLAINDAAHGGQPFRDETRRRVAVVNGEIYNHAELRSALAGRHRLAGRSDCEVVVHLAEEDGPAFLDRLNGIFALCVWDAGRRTGLLARDRLGVKPLYYAPLPDGLLFASELTALLAHPDCPREPDPDQLELTHLGTEDYTTAHDRFVPTYVRGVRQLAPGSWLPLTAAGAGEPRRYWSLEPSLDAALEQPPRPAEAYVTAYTELLEDTVRLQRTADAEVGAFLSGGLDSSVLVAAAAETGPGPECFSISEATTVAAGDVARAAGLAARLGLGFHPVAIERRTFPERIGFDLAAVEEIVWALDGPRFAPELFFKYELHRYARTVRPEQKVVLLGQGADEFAGGYSRSLTSPRASWADYERDALSSLGAGPGSGSRPAFQSEMLRRLVVLASHNLWHEDRVAAAHGTEARVPFLDHRLVELLAAVPPALYGELFFDKQILRRAATRWLPERWRTAPKVLFWQAHDRSSVHEIMAECTIRAYAEFRDAYADDVSPDRRRELDDLRAAVGPGATGRTAVQRLSAAMTWAVFARWCAELGRGRPAPVWRPSSLVLDQHQLPAASTARARALG